MAATGTIDITYQHCGIDNPSMVGFVPIGVSGAIESLLVAAAGWSPTTRVDGESVEILRSYTKAVA